MIYLLIWHTISAGAYYTYEEMEFDLWSMKTGERLTLGYSQGNHAIQAAKISGDSKLNCLVIGGIQGDDESSTLQVMANLREAELREKVLEANIWFVPILNPDGYLKAQNCYKRPGVLDKDCRNLRDIGIDRIQKYADEDVDSYHPEQVPSSPEIRALLSLIKSFDFHLIIAYFSGDEKYIIPSEFPTHLDVVPFIHDDLPFADYGKSKGIFTVGAYVLAGNPSSLKSHTSIFFEFLHRLGPSLDISVEKEMKNGTGILWIYIENKGLYDSENSVLFIESSEPFFNTKVEIEHSFARDVSFYRETHKILKAGIREMKPGQTARVTVVFSYENYDNNLFKIWTQDAKGGLGKMKVAGLSSDHIYIMFGVFALFGFGVGVGIWIKKRDNDEFAGRKISIPNRPLPWEESI